MIEPLFLLMRWIQTIPIAMLMLTPFEDGELRVQRKIGRLFSFAYLFLADVGLAVISAAASAGGHRNIAVQGISLAVVLAVYLACWAVVIRAPAARKMLTAVIMLHYAAILNALSNLLAALISGDRYLVEISADTGSLTFDLCLFAATALTYPLVWAFLRWILQNNLPVLGARQTYRGLGYLCVVFLLFSIVTCLPAYERQPEATITLGSLIITDMIACCIYFQAIGAVRRQKEVARQLSDYQMQYQIIVDRMEDVRQLRHDLRHHFNMLKTLNAQGRTEDLTIYLKEYGEVYEQLEQQNFSGDPAVDSVLGYYLAQTEEGHIPMDLDIQLQKVHGIAHIDMTVLLGSYLENAVEAVRCLPEEQRRIAVELQSVERMVLLRVVNSCEAGADTEGLGFTGWKAFRSGKKKGRTGVGLWSVSEIAAKYGGDAQFQRKGGEFTVQVTLYMPLERVQRRENMQLGTDQKTQPAVHRIWIADSL